MVEARSTFETPPIESLEEVKEEAAPEKKVVIDEGSINPSDVIIGLPVDDEETQDLTITCKFNGLNSEIYARDIKSLHDAIRLDLKLSPDQYTVEYSENGERFTLKNDMNFKAFQKRGGQSSDYSIVVRRTDNATPEQQKEEPILIAPGTGTDYDYIDQAVAEAKKKRDEEYAKA